MQQFTPKENFLIANTLNCVPILLQGTAVLIDLRNDTSIAGRIVTADGHMNIHLTDAVLINRVGAQYPFENFMVRERMIRQIQIPAAINMSEEIRAWCAKGCSKRPLRKPREQLKGKRTFKQKRAEERHKEILQKIEKERKE